MESPTEIDGCQISQCEIRFRLEHPYSEKAVYHHPDSPRDLRIIRRDTIDGIWVVKYDKTETIP